jgi:hypothetical protein
MTLNRVTAGRANADWPCDCGCAQRAPRYPTDLTDEQWAVVEPLLRDARFGGHPAARERLLTEHLYPVRDMDRAELQRRCLVRHRHRHPHSTSW